ncbi:CAP domain-containing protein [Pseudoxanthobacter sp.]|uniref:CAP domain-containing protein n=1 Tax=Pseudoxanthobacter sp. TaxID=1925742 RepID=UPI002FE06AC3
MTRIIPGRRRLPASVVPLVLAGTLAALALASCSEPPRPPSRPTFYDYLGVPGATVDAAMAASMISGYRANHGLGPVTVDPELSRIAGEEAAYIAGRNSIEGALAGERMTKARLARAGYAATTAVENVSAGYRTLAEAFSGWRDSPPHNANMLNPAVSRIGIAIAYAPQSKYKVFWSLILAAPAR